MSRAKLVIANWKMHKLHHEVAPYFEALPQLPGHVQVYVAPPFPLLAEACQQAQGRGIGVLAQNVHHAPAGAFTGEVAAAMLVDIGVQGAIVGHSERRNLCGEDDALVASKVQACLQAKLLPILCVGESEAERAGGQMQAVLRRQLCAVLGKTQPDTCIVAYEPVWAIGTGKTANTEQVQEAHRYLKATAATQSCELTVLYGGSVNAENARTLLALPAVDGVLVGGASLSADTFMQIIAAA